jgi:hypothetical protein
LKRQVFAGVNIGKVGVNVMYELSVVDADEL